MHKFDTPVPPSAISKRQQSGQNLSYLDSHYIITKANELLGHEKWSYTVDKHQVVQSEERTKEGKTRQYVGYVAQVTVTWEGVTRSDVGFGQGIDADLGRAHESAIKEAATDALKRALRTFGQALGLALYDKTGEHIGEPESKPTWANVGKAYTASFDLQPDDRSHIKATVGEKQAGAFMREAWENNVEDGDREALFAFLDSKAGGAK